MATVYYGAMMEQNIRPNIWLMHREEIIWSPNLEEQSRIGMSKTEKGSTVGIFLFD